MNEKYCPHIIYRLVKQEHITLENYFLLATHSSIHYKNENLWWGKRLSRWSLFLWFIYVCLCAHTHAFGTQKWMSETLDPELTGDYKPPVMGAHEQIQVDSHTVSR